MNIPRYFCWTRFGTEAAQSVAQILARKEEERVSGQGVFLWGIGNAVGRSIIDLLRVSERPKVLFSPIKCAPKLRDVNPPAVVAWTSAWGLDGQPFELPERALVTSRYDPDAPRSTHYALVCYSDRPLKVSRAGKKIPVGALQNLLTGRPVGASQVTAVVQYSEENAEHSTAYDVAIEAELAPPYFVRLQRPVQIRLLNDMCGEFDFAAAREEIRQRSAEKPVKQLCFPLTTCAGRAR